MMSLGEERRRVTKSRGMKVLSWNRVGPRHVDVDIMRHAFCCRIKNKSSWVSYRIL
jgi:hypothetical protein